jgi:hypothetical protein
MSKPNYCTQNNGDCTTCSLTNYGRDCQNNTILKTYHINIDWQEPWSAQADEYVAKGSDLRKVTVQAKDFSDALKIANSRLKDDEKDDLNQNNAGVL